MSAVTSHITYAGWARPEPGAPRAYEAKKNREEEFRDALDNYIADYRRHRSLIDSPDRSRAGHFPFFWLRRLVSLS
jgi:hypothetical protein